MDLSYKAYEIEEVQNKFELTCTRFEDKLGRITCGWHVLMDSAYESMEDIMQLMDNHNVECLGWIRYKDKADLDD